MKQRCDESGARKRLTIGFLSENATYPSEALMISGAKEAAERYDVNLIYFAHLDPDNRPINADKLNSLIKQFEIDGLLFPGWTTNLGKLPNVPLLSIGKDYTNIPSVIVDGGIYIREATRHLLVDHGRRHVAYIAHPYTDSRTDSYIDAQRKYGEFDPRYIISCEDLASCEIDGSGADKALSLLLDVRELPVDAIVILSAAHGSNMLAALARRGLRVPEDVALICYEDFPTIEFSKPSFTTVFFPFKELGYNGCERLVQLMDGLREPMVTQIDGHIVYRDSCGCTINKISTARIREAALSDGGEPESPQALQSSLLARYPTLRLDYVRLATGFIAAVDNDDASAFHRELRSQLDALDELDGLDGLEQLQHMLTELAAQIAVRWRGCDARMQRANDLLTFARYLAKDRHNDAVIAEYLELDQLNFKLAVIGKELLSVYMVPDILEVLERYMGWIHIPTCYISLYDTADACFGHCKSVFSLHEHRNLTTLLAHNTKLQSTYQQYAGLKNKQFTLMVMLLHVNEDQIGVMWMEPSDNRTGSVITLAIQISTALKGSILLQESQTLVRQLSAEITLRKEKEAELAYYADIDSLTHLFNRRFFYETLHKALHKARSFTVFYIDIDGFKQVNDTLGHDMGDSLLVHVAERIAHVLKDAVFELEHTPMSGISMSSAVFRLGGDEFTALLKTTDCTEITACAQQLNTAISYPFFIMNQQISISCSIGISSYPGDADDMALLLRQADTALYKAKKSKNSYEFHSACCR